MEFLKSTCTSYFFLLYLEDDALYINYFRNGHVEVVELLLTNLCLLDVNAGDKNYKKTPLHYACE